MGTSSTAVPSQGANEPAYGVDIITQTGQVIPEFPSSVNIQAQVELAYVQTGNIVIYGQLAGLQSALVITNNVLNTLTSIQQLHNEITVSGVGNFPGVWLTAKASADGYNKGTSYNVMNVSSSAIEGAFSIQHPSDFVSIYETAASAFFGKAINPVVSLNGSQTAQTVSQVSSIRSQLQSEISGLSANPKTRSADITNQLRVLLSGMPAANIGAIDNWILDNYTNEGTGAVTKAGVFQNEITDAITSAENLNNTQQQQVQQYLFEFEQFYESASAILYDLTQAIEKMAQHISAS